MTRAEASPTPHITAAALFPVAVLALVVGPVVFGSTYAGYKDTFSHDDAPLANPAYR